MKKKIIAALLCACMIVGLLPQVVLAAPVQYNFQSVEGYDVATVRYIKSDGTYGFAEISGEASTGYNYTLTGEASGYNVKGEYTSFDTYELPTGSNDVIVVAEYFNTQKWDGAVDISWYDASKDVFYLATPAQLAGVAAIVNGDVDSHTEDYRIKGDKSLLQQTKKEDANFVQVKNAICYYGLPENDFSNKTIYLINDMDMGGTDVENMAPDEDLVKGTYPIDWEIRVTDEKTEENMKVNWAPIGGLFTLDVDEKGDDPHLVDASFNGVLDGQGHRIYNLYCNRFALKGYSYSHGVGLIGNIGGLHPDQATPVLTPAVRNLSVDGYVLGRRLVGGIVGNVGGTVGTKGPNSTMMENPDVYIENVANHANVFCTDSKGCGGVVAGGWGTGHIYNCYNTGNISSIYSTAPMGGICASNSGMDVYNCYSVGIISSINQERARAIGSHNGGTYTVDDCYYLVGTDGDYGYNGWYLPTTGVTATANCKVLSDVEMKSSLFVDTLNNNGVAFVYNEGGYPKLVWESDSEYSEYNVSIQNPTTEDGQTETVKVSYTAADLSTSTNPSTKILYLSHEDADGYMFRAYTANGIEITGSHYTLGSDVVISALWEEKLPGVIKIPESSIYTLTVTKDGFTENEDGGLSPVEDLEIVENDKLYEKDRIYVSASLNDGVAPVDINYVYNTNGAYPYEFYFVYKNNNGNEEEVVASYHSNFNWHEVKDTITNDGVYLEVTVVPAIVHKDWAQIYDEYWYQNVKESYETTDEFEISTGNQLAALRKLVNDDKLDFSGKTVKLTADISLDNILYGDGSGIRWWRGIGNTNITNTTQIPFCGTFDGQGHSIVDMTAVNQGTFSGLFSYTKGATIKNLTVEGRAEAVGYVGGIVGKGESTTIENCTNYVKVTGGTNTAGSYIEYAGGIAGYLGSESKVISCSNYGVITNSNGVGGIVGYLGGGSSVTDCLNAGSVISMALGRFGNGGIVGHSSASTIERCANYAMVSAKGTYVGGIVGVADGTRTSYTTINDSMNVGLVRSTSELTATAGLGGVTGYGNYYHISNSYNYGEIVDVSGYLTHVGGVIGRVAKNSLNEITNTYYLEDTCEYSVDGDLVNMIAPATAESKQTFKSSSFAAILSPEGSFGLREGGVYPELKGLVAENSEPLLTFYVRKGFGENTEVRTYSLRELLKIASTYPLGAYQYGSGSSNFIATDTYVVIEDLIKDAGETFSYGDGFEVAQVGDPYATTYEDLLRCRYYIITDEDDESYQEIHEVPNVIAIDWGQSQSGLEDTINNIQSYKKNPSLRFGMGSDPDDPETITRGYRLVSGVKTVCVVHPATVVVAESLNASIGLSWESAENATNYELLKYNEESRQWETLAQGEDLLSYTDNAVGSCENSYSYKVRVYNGASYMDTVAVKASVKHSAIEHEIIPASCTEDGQEAFWNCNVCGKLFKDEECTEQIDSPVMIPATGHDWDAGVITRAATKDTPGEILYTCNNCDETRTESVAYVAIEEFALNMTKAELATNETLQLVPYFMPEDATDQEVTWVSSDPAVAAVDENGLVTVLTYGKTVITATDADGHEVTCEIQTRFYDVLEDNVPASTYKTVYWGTDNSLVSGYDGGVYFGPEKAVTRAEMAVFLYRLAGRPSVKARTTAFSDVNSGTVSSGALKAISWAVEAGIAKGYDDGSFKPEGNCTRAEMAVFLYRLAGRPSVSSDAKKSFSDMNEVSSGALKAISWAVEAGITKGYSDGTFKPADSCSRANTVTFMYRFDKLNK